LELWDAPEGPAPTGQDSGAALPIQLQCGLVKVAGTPVAQAAGKSEFFDTASFYCLAAFSRT
jgi:hypothetical protein